MLEIRIKKMTRRCSCHTPGCKNRNAVKISRRDDVNGAPLYLCPDCIRDIHAAYAAMEAAEKAMETAVNDTVIAQVKEKADGSRRIRLFCCLNECRSFQSVVRIPCPTGDFDTSHDRN